MTRPGFSADAAALAGPVRLRATASDRLAAVLLSAVALLLLAFLALPLLSLLQQALQDKDGRFVWLANFISYARTPALLTSLWNSLWVSVMVTLVAVPAAFVFAYALTRRSTARRASSWPSVLRSFHMP
jgi:iron(III) transport system permease protein